jgi:hypothetical protein
MNSAQESKSEYIWANVFFRIAWPENSDPLWHIDLLIAHKILNPIMKRFESKFLSWQFHRRADRDSRGHEFTFSFFASKDLVLELYSLIEQDLILREMQDKGYIIETIFDDVTNRQLSGIDDKSNKNWPNPLRVSWPHFMTGVSKMWLALIDEVLRNQVTEKLRSIDDNVSLYRDINKSINKMWQDTGQHAFLHYLNAIFGYTPVIIQGKYLTNF